MNYAGLIRTSIVCFIFFGISAAGTKSPSLFTFARSTVPACAMDIEYGHAPRLVSARSSLNLRRPPDLFPETVDQIIPIAIHMIGPKTDFIDRSTGLPYYHPTSKRGSWTPPVPATQHSKALEPSTIQLAKVQGMLATKPYLNNSFDTDPVTMTCVAKGFEESGKDYVVRFNKDTRELTLTRGDVTPYRVRSVKETPELLIVSGLTVKDGPTFRAHFYPDKMMEYFFPDMPTQQDHCW